LALVFTHLFLAVFLFEAEFREDYSLYRKTIQFLEFSDDFFIPTQ
jgi:hypothetical protein